MTAANETVAVGVEVDTGPLKEVDQVLQDLEARSRSFGSALTGALKSSTVDGKSLESVLQSLGSRMTAIALDTGLKPLENLLTQSVSGLTDTLSGLMGFADGGVPGNVTPFATGGVVSSPTYFPMGQDLGLMGEAGAEAIMPLQRGPDGRLGVAASGNAAPSQIIFNVQATDAQSFKKSEGQVSAMLTRATSRGRRGT
jgi:phage-related minor tail protein